MAIPGIHLGVTTASPPGQPLVRSGRDGDDRSSSVNRFVRPLHPPTVGRRRLDLLEGTRDQPRSTRSGNRGAGRLPGPSDARRGRGGAIGRRWPGAGARVAGHPVRRLLRRGPPSGASATPANGRTGPFPGQVIPGFSGLVDNGDGTFWAMPDNGFGAKANSADFLLRLYHVTPDWETSEGGTGDRRGRVHLPARPRRQDPVPDRQRRHPGASADRGDFDIESVVRARDGSFWIGEEFGPFLLHVDETGKVLGAAGGVPRRQVAGQPVPGARRGPAVRSSRGFEAMAVSRNGRTLYPIVEGSFVDDPVGAAASSTSSTWPPGATPARTWQYETDTDDNVIGDAFTTARRPVLVIERDDFEGRTSVIKRLYEVDLGRPTRGLRHKRSSSSTCCASPTPTASGLPIARAPTASADRSRSPLQSVETVCSSADGRLLVGNDNNYPGSNGRVPGTPDNTEMIIIDVGRRPAGPRRRPARRRPPGRQRLPARAHPGLLRDGHPAVRRRHRTRPRLDQRRRARRPPRERDRRDHRRRRRTPSSPTAGRPRRSTASPSPGGSPRTSRSPSCARCGPGSASPRSAGEHRVRRALPVPTFEEVVDLARHSRTCDGRPVGVYPETKHPTYFDSIGLSLEEELVGARHQRLRRGRRTRCSSRASRPPTCASSTG